MSLYLTIFDLRGVRAGVKKNLKCDIEPGVFVRVSFYTYLNQMKLSQSKPNCG